MQPAGDLGPSLSPTHEGPTACSVKSHSPKKGAGVSQVGQSSCARKGSRPLSSEVQPGIMSPAIGRGQECVPPAHLGPAMAMWGPCLTSSRLWLGRMAPSTLGALWAYIAPDSNKSTTDPSSHLGEGGGSSLHTCAPSTSPCSPPRTPPDLNWGAPRFCSTYPSSFATRFDQEYHQHFAACGHLTLMTSALRPHGDVPCALAAVNDQHPEERVCRRPGLSPREPPSPRPGALDLSLPGAARSGRWDGRALWLGPASPGGRRSPGAS